jgi:hypothetical protein
MDGLHGCDDIELRKARRIIGMDDLHMFDAMTPMRQVVLTFIFTKLLEGIQHFMVGAVTNGMDGHAQANISSFAAMLKKFFAIHIENALVVRLASYGWSIAAVRGPSAPSIKP